MEPSQPEVTREANDSALAALHRRQINTNRLLLTVCLLLLALVAADGLLWLQLRKPATAPSPVPIFQRVIEDAASATPQDVSNSLNAIRSDNPRLVWRPEPDGARRWLKVVSWMSDEAYRDHYAAWLGKPEGTTAPPGQPRIWVTLAPEVQQFCRQLQLPDPGFRLKQFLGLDPNRSYQRFVELWIQPEDLFRPCPDPETDDHRCELDFRPGPPPRVKNIDDYPAFFQGLVAVQYRPDGAPWTRLGYTYDWAYGTRGVGASEFVMVPEARFLVAATATTAEYCAR